MCTQEALQKIPYYARNLSTLGEMVVVRSISIVTLNLKYWVMAFMFLGYAQNNIGGTYHMLNLSMKLIVLIHDKIRMNKTYSGYVSR